MNGNDRELGHIRGVLRAVLAAALSCLLLAGCGGGKQGSAGSIAPVVGAGLSPAQGRSETGPCAAIPGGGAVPSIDELRAVLHAELERLGIDPAKAAAAAPQGQQNAVFDLSADVVDPDGEGGEPPTGIELSWTEQLQGDYDQNGLVNYSDLTSISQQWQEVVSYDAPALHGGFAWWPSGDPDDEGKTGSADVTSAAAARPGRRGRSQTGPGRVLDPPLRRMPVGSRRSQQLPPEGSGALNWRRARVDGQRDGLITVNEITPIGQHWLEQLSGYRVYVKGPGDAGFALHDTATTTRDNFVPVRYSYTVPVDASGLHGIYVAAYDDESGGEGPASAAVYVDVDTGSVNHGPVASLSVMPGFAGAPAEITLDATASYDVDGTVAAYMWDFDGDGAIDWVSTEPVPELSSGGTVESITPGADGVVTATYKKGSAQWLYPSVVAVDDQDAESLAATAKLGISGWKLELITDEEDPRLGIENFSLDLDPATGQVVAYGTDSASNNAFIAWREGPGVWREELIVSADTHEYFDGSIQKHILLLLGWGSGAEPLAFMSFSKGYSGSFTTRSFIGRRLGTDNWQITRLYEPEGDVSSDLVVGAERTGAGQYLIAVREFLTGSRHQARFIGYQDGGVTVSDAVLEADGESEIIDLFDMFCVNSDGYPSYTAMKYSRPTKSQVYDFTQFTLNQQVAAGQWEQIVLTPADLGIADYVYLQGMYRDPAGGLLLHVRGQNANTSPDYETTGWYAIRYPSTEKITLWSPGDPPVVIFNGERRSLFNGPYGTSCLLTMKLDYAETIGLRSLAFFRRFEAGLAIQEDIYRVSSESVTSAVGARGIYVCEDGARCHVVLTGENMPEVPGPQDSHNRAYVLATRVDPRLE